MILRSLFVVSLMLTFILHSLNAINPAYLRGNYFRELMGVKSNDVNEDENPLVILHQEDDHEQKPNDEDYDELLKRSISRSFYLSPLWLSRRTRTSRMFGKPLWISRPGR